MTRPELPDDEREESEIDRRIADLGRTGSASRRLDVLDRLISYWHGPCRPEHGWPDEELRGRPIPGPLLRLYRRAGRRLGDLFEQNRLLDPDGLILEEDRVIFYVENQGVYLWSTTPRGGDPPVWGKVNEDGEPWVEEEATLSGFLIQACLLEGTFAAPYRASVAWADRATLEAVTAPLRLIPLGAWRWPMYPTRLWAGGGAFAGASPNCELKGAMGYSIWVGARRPAPLAYLKPIVASGWEYVAL